MKCNVEGCSEEKGLVKVLVDVDLQESPIGETRFSVDLCPEHRRQLEEGTLKNSSMGCLVHKPDPAVGRPCLRYLIAYTYSVYPEGSASVSTQTGSETVATSFAITPGWIGEYEQKKAAEIKKHLGFPFDPAKTQVFVHVLSFSFFMAEGQT